MGEFKKRLQQVIVDCGIGIIGIGGSTDACNYVLEEAKLEFPNHLIKIFEDGTVHILGDYTLESLNWFKKWFGEY